MSKKSVEVLNSKIATNVCTKWNIEVPENVIEVLEKMDKVNIDAIHVIFFKIDYIIKNILEYGKHNNISDNAMGEITGYLNCMDNLKLINYKERWVIEEWLFEVYYDCYTYTTENK